MKAFRKGKKVPGYMESIGHTGSKKTVEKCFQISKGNYLQARGSF